MSKKSAPKLPSKARISELVSVLPGLVEAPVAVPAKKSPVDVRIIRAIGALADKIEVLESRPTTKVRKARRPRTEAELAFLAKVRDDWFRKMGYGPYKKGAAKPVETETEDDSDELSEALSALVE